MSMKMHDHPEPVKGAASYYASQYHVVMRETTGAITVIDTRPSLRGAAISARAWQRRENAAVEREARRQAKRLHENSKK